MAISGRTVNPAWGGHSTLSQRHSASLWGRISFQPMSTPPAALSFQLADNVIVKNKDVPIWKVLLSSNGILTLLGWSSVRFYFAIPNVTYVFILPFLAFFLGGTLWWIETAIDVYRTDDYQKRKPAENLRLRQTSFAFAIHCGWINNAELFHCLLEC